MWMVVVTWVFLFLYHVIIMFVAMSNRLDIKQVRMKSATFISIFSLSRSVFLAGFQMVLMSAVIQILVVIELQYYYGDGGSWGLLFIVM